MATVGTACNMQMNYMCLTLIGKSAFYDLVRVVKVHTTYIQIGDDPGFVAVCYSDSSTEREDDNEVLIDTQPSSFDTPASPGLRESFFVQATTPRRNICVMTPDEYRVYRD